MPEWLNLVPAALFQSYSYKQALYVVQSAHMAVIKWYVQLRRPEELDPVSNMDVVCPRPSCLYLTSKTGKEQLI